MTVPPDSREPDPGSELEDEGIPDHSGALPSKVITGDPQEDYAVPRDYPIAADEFGTTAAETRDREPLDDRLRREQPDRQRRRPTDDDPYPADEEEQTGRFAESREGGTNKEQDSWAEDVGADGGGYTAEERAMHETDEPPLG
jgi:hypothetical protein